ncbi:hypothetical protein [Pseudomonas aeruginosa]|uniref:hypothetical protein n=1 Tax=Pseudomonas aeruginosa TaxID=287 RepID=UPI0003BB1372|nr:hypothetical protein [Pseudomonas aeruginosa]ERX41064.1 hypothetical protein Q010_01827 [Pseudomonas aeruginosa 19660]
MSSTQHQLIEQCATRLRGIVEALDNIHDNTPHRWSTDLDDVHSSAESLLALIKDQAPARSETSFEEWLANELEGEDGQPVPAAVCDIALARRAFNHWPKLEQPAKVGGVRFSAGVSSRLVVEAAQRLYEFASTPEKEAERIERLQAFREQLDPLNLAPHAEAFNEAPADALRPEQAEAERPTYECTMGVGGGDGNLFVHGDHASIKAAQKIVMDRDAALARVAELELKLDKSDYAYDNDRIHMRGLAARAIARAKVFDDGSDGADAESARSVVAILRELLAVGPAQAQHSVPEKVRTLLSRAQCEIEHLAECLENVCEDEEDFDVREDVADGRVVAADIAHMLAAAPDKEVPQAWLDVQAERRRQITAEGWTPEHDDEHADGQMAQAAGCYALHAGGIGTDWPDGRQNGSALFWPWDKDSWKPTTPRRDLVKACALALAEIERLDRAGISQSPQPGATTASS